MNVDVISLENVEEDKVVYLVKFNKDNFLLNIYKQEKDNEEFESYKEFKYNDLLKINGKIVIPEKLGNPYEFDYKQYLNSNNICGTISTYNVAKRGKGSSNIFYSIVNSYKDILNEKVNNSLPKEEAGLFKSMLYSDRISLDEDIKQNIISCGISHILTVSSGSLFYIINIVYLARKFYDKNKVRILQIFFCVFFAFLSGLETSILRALVVVTINLILPEKIKLSKIITISISLYVILLINPYSIFSVGAIYSYIAVFAILFFYNSLKAKVIYILKLSKIRKRKILFKIVSVILNSIILTLSILIFTLPVQIYTYNSFNLITFLSNILIMPFVFYIQAVGYLSMFLVYFFNISNVFISSCLIPLRTICKLSQILSQINLKINIATPSTLAILFYYLIITFYIIRENFIKKLVLSKKRLRIKLKLIIKILSIIFAIYILFEQIYINNFENYVYFFNVKQGNMCIVRKNRKTIIVDMGSTNQGLSSNIINKFLKAKNVTKIDAILFTHMHSDHVSGIYGIDEKIKIEKVAIGKILHTINEEYQKLKEFLDNRNIKCEVLSHSDILEFNDISVYVVSPSENIKIESNDEINSNSAVYLLSIKNSSKYKTILFMGDATKETEKYILSQSEDIIQNVDVYQVGHHGSKTSTSEEFLKKVNPKISIISSYKKVYSHPSKETVELFNKYNFTFYITEQDKAIKINI